MTTERIGERAGLRTIEIGDPRAPLTVVVLHGRAMEARDLAPFAHSLAIPAHFVFPDAPIAGADLGLRPDGRGRSWWPVDAEARLRALAEHGALDLHAMDPPGRAAARARLETLCGELAGPIALVGFSQGGMLAMDYVLHAARRPVALALLSSTRIALSEWTPRSAGLARLPMLVSHGRADLELAFSAGENLRDFAIAGGADVTWIPFDGPHEIPLVVWRGLRRFLRTVGG